MEQPRQRRKSTKMSDISFSTSTQSSSSSSTCSGFVFGSAAKTSPVHSPSSPKTIFGFGASSVATTGQPLFGTSSTALNAGSSSSIGNSRSCLFGETGALAGFSFGVSTYASSATASSPITFSSSSISSSNTPPASISNSTPISASTAASIGDSKPSIFSPAVENSKASDSKPDSSSSPAKDSSNSSSSQTSKSPSSSSPELEKESRLPLVVVSRIINGIPQSPHFYQFRNLSEQTRESLISSLDFVYENTVNQLHNLQVENFWIKAKEMWRTMEDLQSMGYNVIALRRRLVELSDVMMERNLAEVKIEEMKIRGEDHRLEMSRLDFLILSLRKMAEEEEKRMEGVLAEAAKREKELPKFDDEFVKLAMKHF